MADDIARGDDMTKTERDAREAGWRQRVVDWRGSGKSGTEFCREHELAEWQFRYWVGRISDLDNAGGEGFAQVASPRSGLSLSLPGGLHLEVEPDFDESTLKRFLRAVSPAC